jgi:glutamyl-tRNA reductase
MAWMQAREVIPTVVALRERFEAIRRSELDRLEPKLAACPPEARHRLDEITQLIVQKLLLDADRTAEGRQRRGDGRGLCRRAQPALPPRRGATSQPRGTIVP